MERWLRLWPLCVLVLGISGLYSQNLGLAVGGAMLVIVAPGLAVSALLPVDRVARIVLGLVAGLAVAVLAATIMVWTPLNFERTTICVLLSSLTVIGLFCAFVWGSKGIAPASSTWAVAAIVLGCSLALRLLGSAQSEFMGDEAKVLLWATDVIQGRKDIVLLHRKGPAEILLTALNYAQTVQTTEFASRLPYALAASLGATCLALLVTDRHGWRAGLVTGLVASVDGFLLGFGHVVQYPNLVICFGIGAVWTVQKFAEARSTRLGVLAALLVAALALCHWDFLWYVLIISWMLFSFVRHGEVSFRTGLTGMLSIVVGLVLAGMLFYYPALLGPAAQSVQSYLVDRVAGRQFAWRNNWGDFVSYAITYNSVYFAVFLGVSVLAGIIKCLRASRYAPANRRWLFALATTLLLVALVWVDPSHWARGISLWALLSVGLYVVIFGERTDLQLPVLWLIIPLAAYLFAVKKPLLSIYNTVPGAAVLAGVACGSLLAAERVWRRRLVTLGLALVFALSASYAVLVFARADIEYVRTFPRERIALFWTPFGDSMPDNARVGFSHRAGWAQIGELYDCGALRGTYWSNEEELITHWYTRGAIRCSSDPTYVFIAENVKDEQPIDLDLEAYQPAGLIRGSGASTITILARRDTEVDAPLACQSVARDFASTTTPELYTGRPRVSPDYGTAIPGTVIDGLAKLQGFSLQQAQTFPGQIAEVRLHYQALATLKPELIVSLQLLSGPHLYYQQGMSIDCGLVESEDWIAGTHYVSRYGLEIPKDMPLGWYRLSLGALTEHWVEGLLEPTAQRLCDVATGECADRLNVGKIRVGEPEPLVASRPVDIDFSNGIRLSGYDLDMSGQSDPCVADVTLYWEQTGAVDQDLTVFVHLVDQQGAIVAQRDSPPVNGTNLTSTWVVGEQILDHHTLDLPAALPRDTYLVRVGLYDPVTGQRVALVQDGSVSDHVALCWVTLGGDSCPE